MAVSQALPQDIIVTHAECKIVSVGRVYVVTGFLVYVPRSIS